MPNKCACHEEQWDCEWCKRYVQCPGCFTRDCAEKLGLSSRDPEGKIKKAYEEGRKDPKRVAAQVAAQARYYASPAGVAASARYIAKVSLQHSKSTRPKSVLVVKESGD